MSIRRMRLRSRPMKKRLTPIWVDMRIGIGKGAIWASEQPPHRISAAFINVFLKLSNTPDDPRRLLPLEHKHEPEGQRINP